MAWVTALLYGGSTLLDAHNRNSARQDQSRALEAGLARLRPIMNRANTRISRAIDSLATSDPEEERAAAMAGFVNALRSTQNEAPTVPGASDRYGEALDAGEAANLDYSMRLADLFSRIDSAVRQRRGEAHRRGRTAMDLSLLGREARGVDYITRLRAGQIAPNPWITALSDFGQAYALSRAGNEGGG